MTFAFATSGALAGLVTAFSAGLSAFLGAAEVLLVVICVEAGATGGIINCDNFCGTIASVEAFAPGFAGEATAVVVLAAAVGLDTTEVGLAGEGGRSTFGTGASGSALINTGFATILGSGLGVEVGFGGTTVVLAETGFATGTFGGAAAAVGFAGSDTCIALAEAVFGGSAAGATTGAGVGAATSFAVSAGFSFSTGFSILDFGASSTVLAGTEAGTGVSTGATGCLGSSRVSAGLSISMAVSVTGVLAESTLAGSAIGCGALAGLGGELVFLPFFDRVDFVETTELSDSLPSSSTLAADFLEREGGEETAEEARLLVFDLFERTERDERIELSESFPSPSISIEVSFLA